MRGYRSDHIPSQRLQSDVDVRRQQIDVPNHLVCVAVRHPCAETEVRPGQQLSASYRKADTKLPPSFVRGVLCRIGVAIGKARTPRPALPRLGGAMRVSLFSSNSLRAPVHPHNTNICGCVCGTNLQTSGKLLNSRMNLSRLEETPSTIGNILKTFRLFFGSHGRSRRRRRCCRHYVGEADEPTITRGTDLIRRTRKRLLSLGRPVLSVRERASRVLPGRAGPIPIIAKLVPARLASPGGCSIRAMKHGLISAHRNAEPSSATSSSCA